MKAARKFLSVMLVAIMVLGMLPQRALSEPVSATISPTSAEFDKYDPHNVAVAITLNNAESVTGVTAGGTSIGTGNYEVDRTTLTIKQGYLASQPEGSLVLTIEFAVGDSATLTITIEDSTPVSATISPTSAEFDKYDPHDVAVAITLNDAESVTDVTAGGSSIGTGNYEVDGTTLTIKQGYLASQPEGALTLTIEFAAGDSATLTIAITDNTPVSATISPTTGAFDKNPIYQADVTAAITWNSASLVTDVTADGSSIGAGSYAISGNTLAIKKEYLATQPKGSLVLSIEFNTGEPATLTIAIDDSTPPNNAMLLPPFGTFDKNAPADMQFIIMWNDAHSVTELKAGDLVSGTPIAAYYYSVTGDILTIKKEFLASQPEVPPLMLNVGFDVGAPAMLMINITNTTMGAQINPASITFDMNPRYQADAQITITWNESSAVADVKLGGTSIGTDNYSVSGNTLTVKKEFLTSLPAWSNYTLTIEFNAGSPAGLLIQTTDSTMGAEIDHTYAEFDKNPENQADVTTVITWNDATAVTGVTAGGTSIGTESYDVSGNTLTVKKEYLAAQPDGTLDLTIAFDVGDPLEFSIDIIDNTPPPVSATIDPETASFDLYTPVDVTATITWNDATAITDVTVVGTSIGTENYSLSDNTLTVKKEYLQTWATGLWTLIVEFDVGDPALLNIDITDTTPPEVNVVIDPSSGSFDKNPENQADVATTITWNGATAVTDIKAGGTSIGAENYSVSGNTLTIKKEYLASQSGSGLMLSVQFDAGSPASLTITITDTTPPPPVSATIDPAAATFYLFNPVDIWTRISLNDATMVADIKAGGVSIGTESYFITDGLLHIRQEYLASQPVGALELTIEFDVGDAAALLITITDAVHLEGFDDNDYAKLRAFLNQSSGGQTNAQRLGYNPNNPATWSEVTWNNGNPRRVTYIGWANYSLAGNLDVSGFSALTGLHCYNNQLTSLNISGAAALRTVYAENNRLTSLVINANTALQQLVCPNNQLTSLDVSGSANLWSLSCNNNLLESLNISGCTALANLSCINNRLTTLDASNLPELRNLQAYDNRLASLNVSRSAKLETIDCQNNQLTALDASGLAKLKHLYCHNNLLESLNISGCTALADIVCEGNRLTSLNAGNLPALRFLVVNDNQLTSLNVSGSTALATLDCFNNQLTALDVSGLSSLFELNCSNNNISSLDLSGLASLTDLNCSNNQISALDLSGNTVLAEVKCANNRLTSLTMGTQPRLEGLACGNNLLTSLDVSGCGYLYGLSCSNNRLTHLDLSGNTNLEALDCGGNPLRALKTMLWGHILELTALGSGYVSLVLDLTTGGQTAVATPETGASVIGWAAENVPLFIEEAELDISVFASDIHLLAGFTCIVHFDSQGGSDVPSTTVPYDETVSAPAAPTRLGHTLSGWYKEAASQNAWNFETDTVTGTTTLYAGWTRNSYTVTLDSQGGSAVPVGTALYDTTVSAPANPTRTGYTFGGWYKEAACTNTWNFAIDKVTQNITLYASWLVNTYTVTFESQDGSTVPSTATEYDTTIIAPANPTRTGYTFNGWYREPACQNAWNFETDTVMGTTTLYAGWTRNSYTVTLDSQGGSAVPVRTALYDTTVSAPGNPTRTGYTFGGWYTEAACTNAWSFAIDKVTQNITLYASWLVNTYTVTFESQDGSKVPSTATEYDTTISAPTNPTRTGYTFNGWYREPACQNAWNFDTDTVMGTTTLYAGWTRNSYTVTLDSQGGSAVPVRTALYDTTISAPGNPTRTGYTFSGWYREPACQNAWNFDIDTVTGTTTLYAGWTRNSYTVTFSSQGGSAVPVRTSLYDTTISAPGNPVRTGYTFGGWYKEAACTNAWNFATGKVTQSITLYARWLVNAYTVTFLSLGGSAVPSKAAQYNSTISAPGNPVRTGYAFAGWYKEAACVSAWSFANDTVTSNITLYARWLVNAYTVTFLSQGGSAVPSMATEYDATIIAPANPVRTGYAFGGWYKEAACTNAWNFATGTVTQNITLYARWLVNAYTVTFNSQSGSVVPSKTAQYDATISVPANPVRTGYTFAGWHKEAACQNAWNFATEKVTQNITLYASWLANSYTVTFLSLGGSEVPSTAAQYDATISAPAGPARPGYTFGGWYKEAACQNAWNFATEKVTQNITLYASWLANPYTVTFLSLGGSEVPSTATQYDATISAPADPARPGYTFSGWYKEAACQNAWNFATEKVTQNITLYARWTSTVNYTISAKPNSTRYGLVTGTGSHACETVITLTAIPKPGYRFVRWLEGRTTVSTSAEYQFTVGKDRTLKAEFAKIGKPYLKISVAGHDSIILTWGAVAGAVEYEVYRTASRYGQYTQIATTTGTGYTDVGLTTDITYYYKVRAICLAGGTATYGSHSSVRSAKPVPNTITAKPNSTRYGSVTGAGKYASGAEITLTAIPKPGYRFVRWLEGRTTVSVSVEYRFTVLNSRKLKAEFARIGAPYLRASAVSHDSIALTWRAVSGAAEYEIYRAVSKYGEYTQIGTSTGTGYTDTELTAYTTYYYKVRAKCVVDGTAMYGGYSSVRSAKPILTTITARPSSTRYGTVIGAGEYKSGEEITLTAIPKPGYRFVRWLEGRTTVSTSIEYKFTVLNSRKLKAEFARIRTPSLKVSALGHDSVRLTWRTVAGAAEYEIYRAVSKYGEYTQIGSSTGTGYTDTELATYTTYYYKMRAKCVVDGTAMYGGYSSVKSANPILAKPSSVKAAPVSNLSVQISWGEVAGATGYEVYRAASRYGSYLMLAQTSSVSFADTNLTAGKTCYYKVRAWRLVGTTNVYSLYSVIVSAKP